MNAKRILSVVIFVAAATVGFLAARTMTDVGWVPITALLVAGAGMGLSLAGLGRQGTSVGTVGGRTTTLPVGKRARAGGQNRGGRQRQGKGQGQRKKPARTTGKVKWFDETKGFGFITLDDGERDCFVHRSAIKTGSSLAEGKRVEFSVIKDERGRQAAENVELI